MLERRILVIAEPSTIEKGRTQSRRPSLDQNATKRIASAGTAVSLTSTAKVADTSTRSRGRRIALRTIHLDEARQRQREQRQDGAFHHDLRAAENEQRRRQQDDELPDEVAPRVRGLPREPGHSQDIDDRVEHVEADRAQPIRPLRQGLVHEKVEEIENVRLARFGGIAQWRPDGPGDVQGLVVMNADVPKQHRSKDSETARAGHQARCES